MRIISTLVGAATLVVAAACATVPPMSAPPPKTTPAPSEPGAASSAVPSGATPAPSTAVGHGGPWTFAYAPGSYTYTLRTDAHVTTVPDTGHHERQLLTTQRFTIALDADGSVRLTDPAPPAGVSATCDSVAVLASRVARLVPTLPSQLKVGMTWSDTLMVEGCRGSIPVTSTITETYTVYGDTTYKGGAALLVKRVESIIASGEGTEGQHRILVAATGSGTADLFFNPSAGRFLYSQSEQTTTLDVTTSGRRARFLQQVSEEFGAVP